MRDKAKTEDLHAPTFYWPPTHLYVGLKSSQTITHWLLILVTIILFIGPDSTAVADNNLPSTNPRTTRLGVDDGLISSTINAIAQDPSGMLWIATEQGLNRYDGYEMRLYGNRLGDAKRNIGRSRILSLNATDTELWIGTDYLLRFDYATETFEKFHVSEGMGIYTIKEDKNGHLWIGGYQFGLREIDPISGTVLARYPHLSTDCTTDTTTIINDLAFADDGKLWLASSKGVCIFDPEKKQFFRPRSDQDANTLHATSLDWDNNKRLWIATQNGLFRTDASGVIRKFNTANTPVKHIKSLLVDSQQRVWVGLDREGMLVINSKNDTYVHIQPQINAPFSLGPGAVFSIFEAQNQSIWISIKGFGLYLYDVNKQLFDLFSASNKTPGSLGYPQVLSMTSGNDGALWVATDGGGLYKMPPESEPFLSFKHEPQQDSSLPSNAVIGLSTGKNGDLWIGSWAGGLSRLDTQTGLVESWRVNEHSQLWTDNIFTLYRDSRNQLWISAWDHGVQIFDLEEKQIVRSYRGTPKDGSLKNVNIMAMQESHDGGMWLGGYSGLELIDRNGHYVEHYGQNDKPLSLSGSTVYAIHEDAHGLLWIGTNSGLNILDRTAKSISYVGIADGLAGKAIYGILEDEEGDIWLSSNRGIALYYRESGKVQNFSTAHGLQADEFNRFSYHKSGNQLYFGGVNGFNRFNPLEVKYAAHSHVSHLVLTDFLISNRSIIPGTHYALPKAISHMDRVSLNPEDSVFSIHFASTTLSLSRGVSYQYRLDGFDDRWINTGSDNRRATYTGLPSGEYLFKVQVVGANQTPLGVATSVIIEILPHWWETSSFRAAALIILLSLLAVAYHLRMKSMIRRMDVRQKKREASIYLAKNKKLESLNSELVTVNGLKDDLLRIVAHDLRNPLAGMKMGLELMIDEEKKAGSIPTSKKLERFMSGVLSMLGIVDKLLKKNEADCLPVELSSIPLVGIIELVTQLNIDQAEQKNIALDVRWKTENSIRIIADETLLYQAIDNLLSNAIKFSYPKSNITIAVATTTTQAITASPSNTLLKPCVFISISDQGQGMNERDRRSAFKPYTRLSATPTQGEPSHGTGLYNTRKVVTAMNGRVDVESEGRDKGSTFTIALPQSSSAT